MECSIKGCERIARYAATGWCQTHYHRYWRTGRLDIAPKPLSPDVSYRAAHARVARAFGLANIQQCISCGDQAREWAYDGTDPDELFELVRGEWPVSYSAWPEFYMPLCFPCHRAKDRAAWAAKRTHCGNGHALTVDNTYTAPSKPGSRECRTCRAASAAERYARKKKENE